MLNAYQISVQSTLELSGGNPYHDEAGRFASGGLPSGLHSGKMHELQLKAIQGGFTYQPIHSTSPTRGYVLSIHKDREQPVDARNLKWSDLVKFEIKNKDLLTQSGNHFGAWRDGSRVVLDVSEIEHDRTAAMVKGTKYDQDAIWDLGRGSAIPLRAAA